MFVDVFLSGLEYLHENLIFVFLFIL